MKELDYIKQYFKDQFEKYSTVEFGFKYEYDSITATHIIEVSNEELYSTEPFGSDAFEFSMAFTSIYNELLMFIKPSDPVKMDHVDYSENNFSDTQNYVFDVKNSELLATAIVSRKEYNNIDNDCFQGDVAVFQSSGEVAHRATAENNYALAA